MRACFLGQNVCALGFGVATLQAPPLVLDEQTGKPVGGHGLNNKTRPDKAKLRPPKGGKGPL